MASAVHVIDLSSTARSMGFANSTEFLKAFTIRPIERKEGGAWKKQLVGTIVDGSSEFPQRREALLCLIGFYVDRDQQKRLVANIGELSDDLDLTVAELMKRVGLRRDAQPILPVGMLHAIRNFANNEDYFRQVALQFLFDQAFEPAL